jgi:hypothetical protein
MPPELSVPVGMSLVAAGGEPPQAVAHSTATQQAAIPGRKPLARSLNRLRGRGFGSGDLSVAINWRCTTPKLCRAPQRQVAEDQSKCQPEHSGNDRDPEEITDRKRQGIVGAGDHLGDQRLKGPWEQLFKQSATVANVLEDARQLDHLGDHRLRHTLFGKVRRQPAGER